MYNNPYGPRQPAPPPKNLEGLEARFNALPAAGRYGLTACVGIFFIASCVAFVFLVGESFPLQQPAAAQVSAQITATPTPTLMPTPTPEQAFTPVPTPELQQSAQQPSQPQSAPASLFVTITNAFATDYGPGSVSVHTLPNAALTISVKYCTGSYATTSKLEGTRYADSDGNYTWLWEPETKCKGPATAYVNASLNGQSANTSTNFTVS